MGRDFHVRVIRALPTRRLGRGGRLGRGLGPVCLQRVGFLLLPRVVLTLGRLGRGLVLLALTLDGLGLALALLARALLRLSLLRIFVVLLRVPRCNLVNYFGIMLGGVRRTVRDVLDVNLVVGACLAAGSISVWKM